MNIDELENIAANYKAPMYIFDSDIITDTVEMFRRNLNTASKADINLCYAMKANPFLVSIMNELTDRIEVCSMGEFRICRDKEITPEKLLISGVMKDRQDIYEILDCYGERCLYTAESLMQYSYFKEWCKANKKAVNVYLRLTSGNQFGMDRQTIRNIIMEQINENYSPNISGIHYFSETQKKSMKKIRDELTSLQEFICELEDMTGYHIDELEYGPGIPAAYFEGQDNVLEQHIKEVADIINEIQPDYRITLEMGRAFAAGCGYYMTEVKDIKHSDDKNYCIVNGGMHQLNYDGQIRGMYMPHIRHIRSASTECNETDFEKADNNKLDHNELINTESVKHWTICGELCTGNDVLVQKIAIDDLKVGDKFVFENTGAYSMTEGMALFLSHVLPAIAIYNKKDGIKIIRKEMETYKLNM